jgi:hypothetical protein
VLQLSRLAKPRPESTSAEGERDAVAVDVQRLHDALDEACTLLLKSAISSRSAGYRQRSWAPLPAFSRSASSWSKPSVVLRLYRRI